MENLLDQVGKSRKNIKYETLTYSLAELVRMYYATPQEMEIKPDFQRLFRWSREKQSSFIESLLLEIPIPPLFFFENDDGVWELLDGLQRISTIIKFVGAQNDVPLEFQGPDQNGADWHYENEYVIESPLQLMGGEYLTSMAGLSFHRLPAQLQLNLKRSRLNVYVLKRETDPTYKYEVFKRLNRGGAILEDQELRNCSVRLLGAEFPQFIQELAKETEFSGNFDLPEEQVKMAYLDELALRFFAMKNYNQNFQHDVSAFLTQYMEVVSQKKVAFDFTLERDCFLKTFRIIAKAFPDKDAFRNRNTDGRVFGSFSPTIFEVVSIAVNSSLPKLEAKSGEDVKELIKTLIEKAKSDGLLGAGSNSKKKTLGRVALARQYFATL